MTVTAANTNYGATFTWGGTSVGEITKLSFPEIIVPAVEATNHGSAGVREYVSSMLTEVGEFSADVNYNAGAVPSGIFTDAMAGTQKAVVLTIPTAGATTTWTFQGLITSCKLADADAQSPDAAGLTITVRPTAAVTRT